MTESRLLPATCTYKLRKFWRRARRSPRRRQQLDKEITMADAAVFKSEVKPDWCPGCGDFGVLNSLQKACADLNLNPKDIMVVSGIGCSSNLPGFFNSYGMHTLHGRGVAVANGVKLGNNDLTVVAVGGDGDGYGIGVGHLIHSMRRN